MKSGRGIDYEAAETSGSGAGARGGKGVGVVIGEGEDYYKGVPHGEG